MKRFKKQIIENLKAKISFDLGKQALIYFQHTSHRMGYRVPWYDMIESCWKINKSFIQLVLCVMLWWNLTHHNRMIADRNANETYIHFGIGTIFSTDIYESSTSFCPLNICQIFLKRINNSFTRNWGSANSVVNLIIQGRTCRCDTTDKEKIIWNLVTKL